MANRRLKSDRFYFPGLQNHWGLWLQPWNKKMLAPWKKIYDKPRQHILKQRLPFANKGLYSQSYDFFPVAMFRWELNYKEGWVPNKWCFQIVVLEKILDSPLDCKEIKPVNPRGNQPRVFIGRTDAETEAPILWPHDAKSWLIRKDPDAGNDWRQKEKAVAEDEMVRWNHQFNGHEFEQTPGDSGRHRNLACSSS